MFENAYKITSKSKFSNQNVQIPYHLHLALSYSLDHRKVDFEPIFNVEELVLTVSDFHTSHRANLLQHFAYAFLRLLLKAGCKWYGICTKWVENLLFEVI